MRFFVPAVLDVSDKEMLYQQIRERVGHARLTGRRIYRVKFEQDGKTQSLAVGDSFRRFGGEPVIAIIEADDAYFVCTRQHGAIDGEPFRIPSNAALDIEVFTAVA